MNYLHGKFIWFEHFSSDVGAARAFYSGLFGWNSDPVPLGEQQYPLIRNCEQGIGGFRESASGLPSHWMAYLSVADVDANARTVEAAGGRVLMPPADLPPVGRGATIADPTGAVLCIWKGTEGDRPDAEKVAPGDWYWNECWTPDDLKALAFYERVFGYSHDEMHIEKGTYYVLIKDGVARGGLMKASEINAPPAWLPYVSVVDCDAVAAKAQSLGARALVPPTDIPDVGRFAVLMDPTGAVIGVIRGKFTG
jgi:uncharacterized protein